MLLSKDVDFLYTYDVSAFATVLMNVDADFMEVEKMIHIGVDIGASSGRLVLGIVQNQKIQIEEVHRFSNGPSEREGTFYWDIDHLLQEILKGLGKVKKRGIEQCTLGIDTWAVDYALLDKKGRRIKEIVSYRDPRTDQTIKKVTKKISAERIYEITGIQFLPFNTIYQLYEEDPEILKQTDQILMVPDYLNYRLTGIKRMETTNASTTQLLDARKRDFSSELLDILGLHKEQFAPFVEPGQVLGELKKEYFPSYDLPNCQVIHVASHDTASAVVGTPGLQGNWAYISSGTWSLLGIEADEPIIHEKAHQANYTNEWGAAKRIRFLKNIMGMWVIQEVRKNLDNAYDYSELISLAEEVEPFLQYINLNDERFLNPENMIQEIQRYCKETNQKVPETPGELAAAVYYNLAIIYALELEKLESITNRSIDTLHIVGGGGKNELLNQWTANLSNQTVKIGPTEATAIGNIVMQLIATGRVKDLEEGRRMIAQSFDFQTFSPQPTEREKIKNAFKRATL